MNTSRNLSGKRIFVTGADGFIGSHLTAAAVAAGARVTALSLYNSFDQCGWLDDLADDIRRETEIVRGDIRDAQQMAALCRGQDIVFHLAALISIPYSYEAPSSFVETNVGGTLNVLTASRDCDVGRLVHTSTSEVYGSAQSKPIREDHPLQAQSPYAASKIAADAMAQAFARTYGLAVFVLRPFNTYGPRQSERAVISTAIRQFLDPGLDVVRLGNLAPARDFNYVSDTVAAFLGAAKTDVPHDQNGTAFNAGSGRMVSIADVVDLVRCETGSNKPVEQETDRLRPRDSEVLELQADATRLKDLTGWSPEIALEVGIRETVAWWRERLPGVRRESSHIP